MSKITGQEPDHWHRQDENGRWRHCMRDPRQLGPKLTYWSGDEQAYAAHLDQHEFLDQQPQSNSDDDPLVRAVLDYLNNEITKLVKLRELAVVLRRELASGVTLEQATSAQELKTWLPHVMDANPAESETRR